MTQEQQTAAFAKEIGTVIERYLSERNLTAASIIGVLEIAKMDLFVMTLDEKEEG